MTLKLPDTLYGRTIAVLLVGLGVFHLFSLWIYQVGTDNLLGTAGERQFAERMVSIKRIVAALPAPSRDKAAHELSSASLEVHWSTDSLITSVDMESEPARSLRGRLIELVPELQEAHVRVGFGDSDRHRALASIQLADGSWVNYSGTMFRSHAPERVGILVSTTAMAIGILLISILVVRFLTAPLRAMSEAADRIGVGSSAAALPEAGPREVRNAARAFNAMQARIERLIGERTLTLAAVSHDLKTPITRLRLRAEFVGDGEARQKIVADLDEMEAMIESALTYLRTSVADEAGRSVDVGTVIATICSELTDAGRDVELSGTAHAPAPGRPLALKRAFSNIIGNAVKHAGRARVSVASMDQSLVVTVDDDGPGIPPEERTRVFDPFYRIEGSRSRETGGTGLGLTIAKSVVESHGGTIALTDGPQGRGLRVVVTLPAHRRS